MVAGVHFLPDDPPPIGPQTAAGEPVGPRGQGCGADRLSDDRLDTARHAGRWFAGFAAGLAADQGRFGVTCLAATPPRRRGRSPVADHPRPCRAGQAVRRAGRGPGDGIWVTGTIGDGALGLAVARGSSPIPPATCWPLPAAAAAAGPGASAASPRPGWMCRTGWCRTSAICAAPRAGGRDRGLRCRCPTPRARRGRNWLATCLTGGDDYELLLAVPPSREGELRQAAAAVGVAVTRIGGFRPGRPGVTVRGRDGAIMPLASGGWSHF